MLRFRGYFVFDFGIKGLLKFVIFINVMLVCIDMIIIEGIFFLKRSFFLRYWLYVNFRN